MATLLEFVGVTFDDYQTLLGYQTIIDFIGNVTEVEIEGETYMVFTSLSADKDDELLEMLEETGVGTEYFVYTKSTQNWGFVG